MKRLNYLSCLIAFTFAISGYSSTLDSSVEDSQKFVQNNDQELSVAFQNIIDNYNKGYLTNYIVYDSETDSYEACTAYEYYFAKFLSTVATKADAGYIPTYQEPDGTLTSEWEYVDSGKRCEDLLTLDKKIANKLPKGQDFELLVNFEENGSFIVGYQLVENKYNNK